MSKKEIKNEEKKVQQMENPAPENENPVPETPDAPRAIVVEKNRIEKFFDARYEKRVQKAKDKATKAEDPKPKKKPNWKLLAGIGAGIGALAVGAAAFTDAIRNTGDDSDYEDEETGDENESNQDPETAGTEE